MILWPMADRKLVSIIIYASGALFALILIFGVAWNVWPELADDNRPQFRLEGIADGGFYTGQLSVTFSVKDETTSVARVRLVIDDQPLYDRAIGQKEYYDGAVLDTSRLSEGEHRLLVSVIDSSLWKQLEEHTVVFQVDRTPPVISVHPMSDTVFQGDTIGIIITSNEPLSVMQMEHADTSYDCHPLRGRELTYRGLFPISPFTKPAQYTLSCTARDRAGNRTATTLHYTVRYHQFQSEEIILPTGKQGILSNVPKIQEDREKISSALQGRQAVQFWKGRFKRPAAGIDSSFFGTRRVYNTGNIASWHRGIDIANKEGTPVRAANFGVVLLAEELYMYGNTVILDHGQGVITYYFHMSKLNVKKGDTVAQNDLLGLMGTTGLSTGSHCHWEMRVHDQPVNPDDWVRHNFEMDD